MVKKINKPVDGKKLPDTPEMKAWRKEFESMSKEEHLAKLKALGLSDEELAEFEEIEEKGIPPEEELIKEEQPKKSKSSSKKKK